MLGLINAQSIIYASTPIKASYQLVLPK